MSSQLYSSTRGYPVLTNVRDLLVADNIGALGGVSVGACPTAGGSRISSGPSETLVAGLNGGNESFVQGLYVPEAWNSQKVYGNGATVQYTPTGGVPTLYRATAAPAQGTPPPGAGWSTIAAATGPQIALAGQPVERFIVPANSPARWEWLDQVIGGVSEPTMVLGGASADGTSVAPSLVVRGTVGAEGLSINNALFAADPCFGRGLALGTDYIPDGLGAFRAVVPGEPLPAKYGGGPAPAPIGGSTRVYTTAADGGSLAICQRLTTGLANTPGVLQSNPFGFTAFLFTVSSTVGTDDGEFGFILFNPNWS